MANEAYYFVTLMIYDIIVSEFDDVQHTLITEDGIITRKGQLIKVWGLLTKCYKINI